GRPVFVTEVRKETNEVVLGDLPDLFRDGMYVSKLNWQKYDGITKPLETVTKLRYTPDDTPALFPPDEPDQIKVHFHDGV
ncbi:tRNA 2-thiouridine(34) synthase MnmA, partial [bacterium LRH843]|nr:tRNA 2-thiouridine(34) synthase MnmA [bacterium LRH843]